MGMGRTPTVIGIVIVVFLLAAIVILPRIDWNAHRAWVASQVSKHSGRKFTIDGKLDIRLRLSPHIHAEKVVLGNASGGSDPVMLRADVLDFSISVPQLLFGRIDLPDIKLVRPQILLERNAQGEANWEFGGPKKSGGHPPIIGRIEVNDGKLRYRDRRAGTDIVAAIQTIPPQTATEEPSLNIDANGQFQHAKFVLKGRGGALLALRDPKVPYPINVHGEVGGSQANVNGTITDLVRFAAMDLTLDMKGPDLSKLHAILDIPFPPTPPYRLNAHLLRTGKKWELPDLHGRIGDSDIAGRFAIDNSSGRTLLTGTLHSENMDLADIAEFVGAPPQKPEGGTISAEQKREVEKQKDNPRVLPAKPFNLAALRKVDAKIAYSAKHVKAPSLPIESVSTNIRLENGDMHLEPLRLGLAGGVLDAQVRLDARQPVIAVNTELTARRIRLAKLFPTIAITKDSRGLFGGRAKLTANGNSIAQMAAHSNGVLGVAMNTGEVSSLLVSLAGLDIAKALVSWLGGDKKIPIRCAVADFDVKDGIMKTNAFVFDTTQTKITGAGDISLREEALNLALHAAPKGPSPLSLRSPLHLGGTFKHPTVSVDKGKIAGKVGQALLLGAAAPIAALLPLIERGTGKDSNCGELVSAVKQHTKKATGAAAPVPGRAIK